MSLAPGTKLGPYEIVSPLGAGGMGEVWRARDTRIDRAVALKVLPEEFFESEERRGRFEREARMLASLNHPGIAVLYSFEEIPSSSSSSTRHLLAMELVEGEDLAAHIASGPLPLEESLSYARQIAEALEAAHEKGIVHRDLKPENVFVTRDGHDVLSIVVMATGFFMPFPLLYWRVRLFVSGTVSALEKKLAMAGLADVAHADALKMVEPFLEDAAVQREAFVAYEKIAESLAGRQPALAKEDRFSSNSKRSAARAELRALIVEAFKPLTAAQLVERLDAAQIANARVNSMHDVWAHPQLKARDRWREVATPAGAVPALLPPGSWEEGAPRMDPVPALGQHTEAILGGLGYDASRIAALRAANAV